MRLIRLVAAFASVVAAFASVVAAVLMWASGDQISGALFAVGALMFAVANILDPR